MSKITRRSFLVDILTGGATLWLGATSGLAAFLSSCAKKSESSHARKNATQDAGVDAQTTARKAERRTPKKYGGPVRRTPKKYGGPYRRNRRGLRDDGLKDIGKVGKKG